MSRILLVLIFVISQVTFGQDVQKDIALSKDSIISKLSESYFGAIYKNPDSARTIIKSSFPKYNKDPLIRAWKHHLTGNYFYGRQNADSALHYFDKVFEDIIFNDDPYLFNETKLLSGMVYNNTGRSDDAFIKLKEAETELAKNPDSKPQLKINLYRAMGVYFLNSSRSEESMDYFLKALKLIEADNSQNSLLDKTLMNLAEVSMSLGDFKKTKEYLLSSKDAAIENKNDYYIHKVNIKLAEIALNTNTVADYDIDLLKNAISYFEQARQAVNTIEGNLYLARIYREKNQTSLAKSTFMKALETSKSVRMPQGIINASQNLGLLALDSNDPKTAINYFQDISDLTSNYANIQTNIQLNENLVKAYKARKDYDLAFSTLETVNKLKDSFNKTERYKVTKDIEGKYENEKKEQEIKLLTSEKMLSEQQKKSQRNLLLGGIGLTGLAGIFLFILYRNRKRTADKLQELDSAKSKFFENISHEFRTPLTLISSPIDNALTDTSLSEKKRQQFQMAKRNSDRLLSLVNQLLDLSKIDAGHLQLHIQKGNPTQLIAALSDSFSYSAQQKEINFKVDVKYDDYESYFDKDALEKIVVNLLSNAIKFTPESGSIICRSSITNSMLQIEVKNTGAGLTKKQTASIFQRFYQTNEDNTGTGIGLALVKELVDLHKGTIKADSTLGQSTTFTVVLPVDKNSFINEQFIASNNNKIVSKPTIDEHVVSEDDEELIENDQPILLIVEDNADVRTLLKQTFEDIYNVISAPDGKKGVELALEHVPDIIISDIMMPVKNGIVLTNELKNDERTNHVPIILLTAKAGEENELQGIETGADDYMVKPFNAQILKTKVQKLIETRALLQKRYSQELILKPKDIAYSTLDEEFLTRVQTVLDNRLIEPSFSIEEFSKSVGMSRMQLHRKLKALTGLSASDFVRSQRLKLATELLKKSDVNVSDIGYTVGFNDHSYFTKCFKAAYNMTPTTYAKKFT